MKGSLAVLLAALSSSAYSGVTYDVPASDIEHIRAEGIGGVGRYILQYKTAFSGDTGCANRDFAFIRYDDTAAKEMYSTALSAFVTGKTLIVTTTGCDSFGNIVQSVGIK